MHNDQIPENSPSLDELPEPQRSQAKELIRRLRAEGHAKDAAIAIAVKQSAADTVERSPAADGPSADGADRAARRHS